MWLRQQMAFSLGFHIVLACLGVAFPMLVLLAEWRWLRTGDELWRVIARRWSKALGVLFAIGAVTGTILSFEFGILWPTFMARWGAVFGLAFVLEGVEGPAFSGQRVGLRPTLLASQQCRPCELQTGFGTRYQSEASYDCIALQSNAQ